MKHALLLPKVRVTKVLEDRGFHEMRVTGRVVGVLFTALPLVIVSRSHASHAFVFFVEVDVSFHYQGSSSCLHGNEFCLHGSTWKLPEPTISSLLFGNVFVH